MKAFDQKCKDYHLFVTSPEAKEEIDACLEGCSDVYRNLVSSCKSACEKCKDCEEENKGFYQDCRQSCLSYKKKFLFGVQLTNLQVKDDNDMGIIQYEMEKVATTYNLLPSGNPVLKPDDMHSQKSGQVWCKEGRLYTNNYKIKDEFSKLSGVYFFFEKR
ncbi:MAG: hypothetical protein KDD52_09775 [Bdellovibrionales bacterium]|nr:hypothetical protein [Bdellovibrionales bacterium]